LFAESTLASRVDKQPFALANERRGLTDDEKPKGQILVKFVRGLRGDLEVHMFELINKMVEIESQ
jgi:hypothetical protein